MNAVKECTQCGACLNECPVFRLRKSEEFSPKAKHLVIRKGWEDDGAWDWERMMALAGQCVCCERCKLVCARRLSVPQALAQARARHPRWQQYFWRHWIQHGGMLWSVASRMAPLVPNRILPNKIGIMHAAALAMKAPQRPPAWLRLLPSPEVCKGKNYVIFGGCTATRLRPAWVEKAEAVLHRLGGAVLAQPGFVCCGGTYEHAGMLNSALEAAAKNVALWKKAGMPQVVVFCASCLHSLRHYAEMPGLMNGEESRRWKESLTPLSSLLADARVEPAPQAPTACAYHSPCHWGSRDEDMLWLKKVLPGLHKGGTPCCGFGGVLKMLDPELSRSLAQACWQGMAEKTSPPPVALTGCSGCIMQLNAHAPGGSVVHHWLDVLLV